MNTYLPMQEIKDLLWGTPMPIAVVLNSEMVMIHIKGSCSLIVTDAELLQEKLPDTEMLASHVRSTLVLAATDAIADMSKKVTSVEQLVKLQPEFSMLLKIKSTDGLGGFGLKIDELDIHSIRQA